MTDPKTSIPVATHDFKCSCNSHAAKFTRDDYAEELIKTCDVSPALFLSRACGDDGEPLSLDFLHVLATVIICHSHRRTINLLDRFLRLITDGYSFTTLHVEPLLPICGWELPLLGIINMVTAIDVQKRVGQEDEAILCKVWDYRRRILNIVSWDYARLLPIGPHADHLRLTVVLAFVALTNCGHIR